MRKEAMEVMREYKIFTSHFGDPITVIPRTEMERLCEYVAKLEAEKCKINGTFLILDSHLKRAREKYPEFKGITCVLREVADLIKADEAEDKREVKRQALHVAVTALRLYEEAENAD